MKMKKHKMMNKNKSKLKIMSFYSLHLFKISLSTYSLNILFRFKILMIKISNQVIKMNFKSNNFKSKWLYLVKAKSKNGLFNIFD